MLPSSGFSARRANFLIGIFALATFIIIARLFELQIIKYDYYSELAREQSNGGIILPAKRGEILVRDEKSDELFKLATNITLDLVYADPLVLQNKSDAAAKLSQILWPEICERDKIKQADNPGTCLGIEEKIYEQSAGSGAEIHTKEPDLAENTNVNLSDKKNETNSKFTREELISKYQNQLLQQFQKEEIDHATLLRYPTPAQIEAVNTLALPGIFTDKSDIYANPLLITNINHTADSLKNILEKPISKIKPLLERRKIRYVPILNRLRPEISQKIQELNLKGLVLIPEYWRFYPEKNLASQVIGFLDHDNVGRYGIEEKYDLRLRGVKGRIFAEADPFGRQITVGESEIVEAQDGDNIVLTINRVVQSRVEQLLAKSVWAFRADSGQVTVIDPKTGRIIAMAGYPSFDPNNFGDVYEKEIVQLSNEEKAQIKKVGTEYFLYRANGDRITVFLKKDIDKDGNEKIEYLMYKNRVGLEAFKNKSVNDSYEPGSVFKVITMSGGVDAQEVTPNTTFDDYGPIIVDNGDFTIHNSEHKYHGKGTTMTQVLENSLNTGAIFVARHLGRSLFYKYIMDFGFGERTDIELPGENKGVISYYRKWYSESDFFTKAFGQGLSVTQIQMAVALSAIANGGLLMEPHIIDSIVASDGREKKIEPVVVRRVISEETAKTIGAMMASVVKRGVAKKAAVKGYAVSGKTGTSQTYLFGKALMGKGTTVGTFGGFAPTTDPKFVILIKIDKALARTHGADTAAPLFGEIAEFLLHYYNIPPSE